MRVGRIELPSHPWQGRVLPLNHTRNVIHYTQKLFFLQQTKKERIETTGFHPPVTRLAHTPQRAARAINQIVRPPGLEPGLSVSKTEVISVSLRALISTYYLKIHKISKICYNTTNERLK